MSQFHINPNSGTVSRCNATVNDCPWLRDDMETHFGSIKAARAGWEERMSGKTFKTHSLKNESGQQELEIEMSEETLSIEEKIAAQESKYNSLDWKLRGMLKRSPNVDASDNYYAMAQERRTTFYKLLALKKDRYDSLSDEMKKVDDSKEAMTREIQETERAAWFTRQEEKNGPYNFHPEIDKDTGEDARSVIVSMSGLSVDEVNALALAKMAEGKTITESFREVFAEVPIRTDKPIVAVDIETACPLVRGWVDKGPLSSIIQVGYVIRHPDGRIVKEEFLAGVPDDLMKADGTGAVHVHQITPEMVAGLKPLVNMPEKQAELLKVMENSVMLAHNAAFEIGQFKHSIPGFARAVNTGKIEILDTQHVCRFYCPDTETNTNESFVTGTGGEYTKAHRALQDALMSLNGLLRLKGEPEIS